MTTSEGGATATDAAATGRPAAGGERSRRGGRAGPPPGSWRGELDDIVRAVSGAFLFAVPLLYTMEMWWIGAAVDLRRLLSLLGVAFLIAFGLARTRSGGFKEDTDPFGAFEQAIDVVAVGIVAAAVVLAVLGRIGPGEPIASVLGKVLLQAAPLAVGASVANAVFGRRGERNRQGNDGDGGPPGDAAGELRADFGATVVGAVFVSFAIAPTDEVPMLAAGMDLGHELALVVLSLLVSYAIVFASGYGDGPARQPGPFQHPATETVFAYVVSLLVAAAALGLFGRIEPGDPPGHVVSTILVLGLPAAIGGAAGRLVA
jgi:putative integral membrane protein (TIGR02587 family)